MLFGKLLLVISKLDSHSENNNTITRQYYGEHDIIQISSENFMRNDCY